MVNLPMLPLHDVDIKHLRLFKSVVECGGLSAAEELTGLGISAISKQLSDLETLVGCQLCHRGRSGFSLTQVGQAAYTATLRLLDAIDEFRESLANAKGEIKGELSIWLIDHATLSPGDPVSVAIGRFNQLYPQVVLNINMAAPDLVEQAVEEKRADIGLTICKSNLPNLQYRVVSSENSSMYCGKGHPAFEAEDNKVRDEITQRNDYVRRAYLTQDQISLAMAGRSNAMSHHVEGTLQLLLSGKYIGIVPDHIAQPWVDKGELYRMPLPEFITERPVFLVIRDRCSVMRAANILIELLVNSFRDAIGRGQSSQLNP